MSLQNYSKLKRLWVPKFEYKQKKEKTILFDYYISITKLFYFYIFKKKIERAKEQCLQQLHQQNLSWSLPTNNNIYLIFQIQPLTFFK